MGCSYCFYSKKYTEYGSSSVEGNYINAPSFTYKDITGVEKTKVNGTSVLIPTGQTIAANNIYDKGAIFWNGC